MREKKIHLSHFKYFKTLLEFQLNGAEFDPK